MKTQIKRQTQTQIQTYSVKEIQLTVRDASSLPCEILPIVNRKFRNSSDIVKAVSDLNTLDVEVFMIFHLDSKNVIRAWQVISIGTINASLIHPREVFRAAIINGAVSIVGVHNHPSGDPTPSSEDVTITLRLEDAGKIVGIHVLDHIIIGANEQYFSFADRGLLRNRK